MRAGPAALALAALLLLAGHVASFHRGEQDTTYGDHYTVQGRLVNETGWPVSGQRIRGELFGVIAVAASDCSGDFNLAIPTYETVREHEAIKLSAGDVSQTLRTDPWSRRTDAVLTVPGPAVSKDCKDDPSVTAWKYRYTIEGRIVERTADIELSHGRKLFARPVSGEVVRPFLYAKWINASGVEKEGGYAGRGRGGFPTADLSGNYAWSFAVADETVGGFQISAQNVSRMNVTFKDRTVEITPDYHSRYSYVQVIRGEGGGGDTPGPAVPLLLAGLAAAGLVAARRRAR